MEGIRILGGTKLAGKVKVQGSKNAALPILAATLLTEDSSYLDCCPKITDIYHMIDILRDLGLKISWNGHCLKVKGSRAKNVVKLSDRTDTMRSSLCLLGALLGRCERVEMDYPGGCDIGARPIDLHLLSLEKMGARFQNDGKRIIATTAGMHGAKITLPFPSVGATENIILAAVGAAGNTVLRGAAREPEVGALCEYLNLCGAKIQGAQTSCIIIKGTERLKGCEYRIPADRIVAGTYLLAAVACGGNVFLQDAPWSEMRSIIDLVHKMGADVSEHSGGLYVQQNCLPKKIPFLYTAPYPGIPTDLQSMLLSVRCVGEGECRIEERIFENRFQTVDELLRMGGDIRVLGRKHLIVRGVPYLTGQKLTAKELRGGAALVIAGMAARGESLVTGVSYIERGYENICRDLQELGARIVSV